MKKELTYSAITLFATVFSFMVHEFAHWTTGEALGYQMRMTLNTAYPISGTYLQDWHYTLISAAGPVITLTLSFCFFLLIRKYHNRFLYPFLFSSFYLELLSGIMNFRNPNDLGRISLSFGLGLFAISALFVAIHSFLLFRTTRREGYSLRLILRTLLLVIVFSSAWILLNNRFHIAII